MAEHVLEHDDLTIADLIFNELKLGAVDVYSSLV